MNIDDLGLDAEERACVESELSEDVDDFSAVGQDLMQDAMAVCVRAAMFGPAFAEGLDRQFPGVYSAEQLACLDREYSSLPAEDYDLVIAAALDPEHPEGERARQVMTALYDSCDAPTPPDL